MPANSTGSYPPKVVCKTHGCIKSWIHCHPTALVAFIKLSVCDYVPSLSQVSSVNNASTVKPQMERRLHSRTLLELHCYTQMTCCTRSNHLPNTPSQFGDLFNLIDSKSPSSPRHCPCYHVLSARPTSKHPPAVSSSWVQVDLLITLQYFQGIVFAGSDEVGA